MASTRSHRKATGLLFLSLLVSAIARWEAVYFFMSIGAWLGLILHPDRDIFTRNLLWRPYAWLIWHISKAGGWVPLFHDSYGHRSPLSHLPILGTIGRVLYVLSPFLLTLQIEGITHYWQFWAVFTGLCLADIQHAVMDIRKLNKIFTQ